MSLGISVVIPVYRSQETLEELHRRLTDALERIGNTFEVIFVEDCGGDDSWDVINALAIRDNRVRGIRLSRNYGQHNALLCGIRAAQGDVIITIDDDLQNPPEEIAKLLLKLNEGYDVVYGHPINQTHGFLRNTASRITKLALKSIVGVELANKVSAFRAFRSNVRDAFIGYRSPNVNIEVLLTWGTTRFSSVDVRQDARTIGESGYNFRRLVSHAINMTTGFSTLPLRIASVLGMLFALIGLVILCYVFIRYFMSNTVVPGFTFLASIIAIFSGVQLFCLGIIGEYLARIHLRNMDRPPYTIQETTPI